MPPLKFTSFFKTKFKVSTDYLIICLIISLAIIVISATSAILVYKNNFAENRQILKQNSLKAENIISEAMNEHSWQIRLLADKIMKTDNSLNKINQIISNYNTLDLKSNFKQFSSQKDLFWVDENENVVIKNKLGILDYPQKISKDYEVFNSREKSWRLFISSNMPYVQKDYSLILTSFGVTDNQGKYLGSITSAIDVSLIQNLLNNSQFKKGNFVILNAHNNKIILQSGSKNLVKDPNFFTYKLGNLNYDKNKEGFLKREISANNINYTHYSTLGDYPLVILSGYNYPEYKSHLLKLIFKTVYPNILVGGFLMIVLLLFYKRIVQPIDNLSKIARRIGSGNFNSKFPKKINSPEIFNLAKALLKIKQQKLRLEQSNLQLTTTKNHLEEALEMIKKSDIAQLEIIKQIRQEILKNTDQTFQTINLLKYNLENGTSYNQKMNAFLISNLEQNLKNITSFATDELNKQDADIRHIINNVVLSQEKEIKIRKIKISVSYGNLPKKVFVDQIRLIQVLSSILHKTINLLSEENHIKIEIKTIVRKKVKQLLISITDDGFGIGFKEHLNDVKRLGGNEENSINGIDISVDTFEELIKLHNGEIIYDSKIRQGSTTKIIIPYLKTLDKNTTSPPRNANNIIYLSARKR